MKCRIIKDKRILAGIVLLGILLIGGVVISQAAEDEYRVHHNITIDLDGGVCDGIYYQSQIDHGPNLRHVVVCDKKSPETAGLQLQENF